MRIDVDLASTPAEVQLAEPNDFNAFHVAVRGGRDRAHLDAALRENDLGWVEGDDAFIDVATLRGLAREAGGSGPDWEDGFAKMLEFARSKGWVRPSEMSEDGEAVQAHIE